MIRIGVLLVCLGAMLAPAQSWAAWWWPFGNDGLEYKVEFGGIDAETYAWLEKLKLDEMDKARPVNSQDELEQELGSRGQRIKQALEAIGYYDARIEQSVRPDEPPELVYSIEPGQRYVVGKVTIAWEGGEALKDLDDVILETKVNEPVNAQGILNDGVALLDAIGPRACLLALDVAPLVKIYGQRRQVEVVFRVRHGAKADFGETIVSGTELVKPEVVLRHVKWQQGRCYRNKAVDETRTELIESQLFSSITITHADTPNAQGQVPMTVAVKERAARTLRAGGRYGSDEGVVVTSGWEHRNLWGEGQKLTTNVSVGQEEQKIDGTLTLPAFLEDKQQLVLNAGLTHEDRDAYTADTLETGARIERELARHWRGGLGVGFTLKETEDQLAGRSQYGLLSFPGFVEYDTRRNVLDPRRGIFANVTVTPYTETFGDGGQFLKSQGTLQTYVSAPRGVNLPLSPTLALKVAGGVITGAEGQDVPSDLRFYAGGGGSVRGYGYQTLGPRLNGDTIGGSSFVATSAEARLRFTEEFGGVVFADAGNAYDDTTPDTQEKLYTSVGVGVRYFTGIGPIRADVAFPLNGEDIGARGYAVYISIGQSF